MGIPDTPPIQAVAVPPGPAPSAPPMDAMVVVPPGAAYSVAPQAQMMVGAGYHPHQPQYHPQQPHTPAYVVHGVVQGVPPNGAPAPYQPRTGLWMAGLCDCCGQCWPTCICATCCPCFPLAAVAQRLNVANYSLVLGALLLAYVVQSTFAAVFYQRYSSKLENGDYDQSANDVGSGFQTGSDGSVVEDGLKIFAPEACFFLVIAIAAFVLLICVRKRYALPSPCCGCPGLNCCSIFGDCLASLFCTWCVVAQMARHVLGFKDCCTGDVSVFLNSHTV